MKDVCLVAYVFGKAYQEYIPLFILSATTSYPDYDIRIYLDGSITKTVKEQLEALDEQKGKYEIIENYTQLTKLTKKALSYDQIQKSQRWLFYDKAFQKYKAVYIGDIDILISPEKETLYHQHLRHCNTLNTPYSNICRKAYKYKKYDIKSLVRCVVKYGLKQCVSFYQGKQEEIIKMSGLHFVLVNEYYKAINDISGKFYEELNLLAYGKSQKYNMCLFNNESLLKDLLIECGFELPPLSTDENYNIETNPEKIAFRPHHGLHIGIFRSSKAMENEKAIIDSFEYRQYYEFFNNIKKSSEYKKISKSFSSQLNQYIETIDRYYSSLN
jgi:hypothetical protein